MIRAGQAIVSWQRASVAAPLCLTEFPGQGVLGEIQVWRVVGGDEFRVCGVLAFCQQDAFGVIAALLDSQRLAFFVQERAYAES